MSGEVCYDGFHRLETHLATAKQVVDRFGAELSEQLADIPAATAVRGAMLEESLRFYEELAQYAEADTSLKHDSATAAYKAAAVAEKTGRLECASQLYEVARQRFSSLAETEPAAQNDATACERRLLLLAAVQQNNSGRRLLQEGHLSEAAKNLSAARSTLDELLKAAYDAELRSCLAAVLNNLAMVAEQQGRTQEAGTLLDDAIKHQDAALQDAVDPELRRQALTKPYANQAQVDSAAGIPLSEREHGALAPTAGVVH